MKEFFNSQVAVLTFLFVIFVWGFILSRIPVNARNFSISPFTINMNSDIKSIKEGKVLKSKDNRKLSLLHSISHSLVFYGVFYGSHAGSGNWEVSVKIFIYF